MPKWTAFSLLRELRAFVVNILSVSLTALGFTPHPTYHAVVLVVRFTNNTHGLNRT